MESARDQFADNLRAAEAANDVVAMVPQPIISGASRLSDNCLEEALPYFTRALEEARVRTRCRTIASSETSPQRCSA
jgi:hypothetical protein